VDELGKLLAEELWIDGINWLIGWTLACAVIRFFFGSRREFTITLKKDIPEHEDPIWKDD